MNYFRDDYNALYKLFIDKCAEMARTIQSRAFGTSADEVDSELSTIEQLEDSTLCSTLSKSKPYVFEFSSFVNLFDQMKFAYIFAGHRSEAARQQFYDEVNYFLVSQLSLETTLETKVFSFYLMYTLWIIQKDTLKLSMKIRLDRRAHSSIIDFLDKSLERQQYELVAMSRKLFRRCAFIFVGNLTELGPYYKDYYAKNQDLYNLMNSQQYEQTFNKLDNDTNNYIELFKTIDTNNLEDSNKLCSLINLFKENYNSINNNQNS